MSKKTSTEAIFSHHQLVRELEEICQPRQRALLGLLAACQKHAVDPSPILASFAQDLPRTPFESRRRTRKFYWSRIEDLAEQFPNDSAPTEALVGIPGLLPEAVDLALQMEREHETLGDFNRAWLDRPKFVGTRESRRSFIASVFPLILKFGIILWLTTFIMIWIVPELMHISEDFESERPVIFDVAVRICDQVAKLWVVPCLLVLLAIPLCLPGIQRYFRRWNPFTWQQPVFPMPVKTKQALTLVLHYRKHISAASLSGFEKLKYALGFGDQDAENSLPQPINWQELGSQKILSRREVKALEISNSAEVRAWLLRKSSILHNHQIKTRDTIVSRVALAFIHIVLFVWVGLMTLMIFSALISIVQHLQ